MRILLDIPELTKGLGGAERVGAEMANEMVRRGHQVAVYSDAPPHAHAHYPLSEAILHIRQPLQNGRNADNVAAELARWKPDVTFLFYYNINLVHHFALLERLGRPIGVQECTNPVRAVLNIARSRDVADVASAFAVREAFLSRADAIRFTMPSYARYAPAAAAGRVRAFVNCFPVAARRLDLRVGGDRKRIINVGGLKSPNKNGVVLARAFARIAGRFPDWEVHFFGKNNVPEVADIAEDNALSSRLVLHGNSTEIHSEYHASAIHVICSRHEGCPNVVCEAMGHGLPSIGYADCRGTNELIVDGKNGLLIARDETGETLAEALVRLITDENLRDKLGAAAYRDAKRLFPARIVYDQWEELFSFLHGKARKPGRLARAMIDPQDDVGERWRAVRRRYSGFVSPLAPAPGRTKLKVPPAVSVVVPLYNKQAYIEETLRSIIGSSFEDMEVIVVDDCSSDGSAALVAGMAGTDKRIRLLRHKRNRGLSAARNTGLADAGGRYIQFWDADDVLDKNWLNQVIPILEEDGSQIATGVAVRDGKVLDWYLPSKLLSRRASFALRPEAFAATSTCFKLYARTFLERNELSFVEGLYMQDTEFNLRAFPLSATVSMTPYVVGEYCKNADSWSSVINTARMDSCFDIDRLSRSFYRAKNFDELMGFRGDKVMRFVFNFFIVRLLRQMSEVGPADMEPSLQLLPREVIGRYIERFRKAVAAMPEGLEFMAKHDVRRALAYIAFAAGRPDAFMPVLRGRTVASDIIDAVRGNELGVPRARVDSYLHAAGIV